MRKGIIVLFCVLGAACSGGDAPAAPTSAAPTTPALTAEDLHGEWCGAMQPYIRIFEDTPMELSAADIKSADEAVDTLDAMSVKLSDNGLDAAADAVSVLADSMHEQIDIVDSDMIAANFADRLSDMAKASKALSRDIDPAVAEMGTC